MKNGKILFLILLVCAASTGLTQDKKAAYPNLAGKWVLKNDPGHTLLVKNDWIYETRLHPKQTDTCKYGIANKPCYPVKKQERKNLFLLKKDKAGNDHCYKLLSWSSNAFSMRSATGDTLYTFIRYLKRY